MKSTEQERKKEPFYHGGEWYANAVMWWGGWDSEFYQYTEGYFRAANMIAASMLLNDFIAEKYRGAHNEYGQRYFDISLDTGVFPMLFLYRHYLELALKNLLRRMYNIQGKRNKKYDHSMVANHSLGSLSSKCLNEIRDILKPLPEKGMEVDHIKEFNIVIKTCTEIDELDQRSMAARYPLDKADHPYMKNERPLNIELFMDRIQQVREILSHCDYFVSYYEQMSAEQ